ncbi:MAG: alpha/beta hydrolase [Deltaproteobacteria bacterium]
MKILCILFFAVLAFSAYLLVAQHRLIYFPKRLQAVSLPPGFERISYQSESGRQTAYYLPASQVHNSPPDRLWILFGGNASLALDWLPFVSRYKGLPAAFLLFDYPGYGECEGRASPDSIQNSLLDCLRSLADRLGLPFSELIDRTSLLGHSLGAAVALQFAERFPVVHKIILLAPFTTMIEMAKRTVPFPFYYLLLHRYNNLAILDKLTSSEAGPQIIIMHGSRDEIVPRSMAKTLARRYSGKIKFHEIDNADHNSVIELAEEEIYGIMGGRQAPQDL